MAADNPFGRRPYTGKAWNMSLEEQAAYCHQVKELLRLPIVPTVRQATVLTHSARGMNQPILFGGAKGGGKSALLCMWSISKCRMVPENRILLARKTHQMFTASTLQELEKQLKFCPDAHKFGDHEIRFDNGSEIWYVGTGTMNDILKFGSTEFGGIGIDEATEIDRGVLHELQQRCRHKPAADANQIQIIVTGNPYPGWVKEDWISMPKPGRVFVRALMRDNPFIPPGYEEEMIHELTPEERSAFIDGDWDALSPSDQAIPEKLLVEGAQRRETPDYGDGTWGIDVARKGNDYTCVYARYGYHFEFVDKWQHSRLTESADRIKAIFMELPVWARPKRFNVDDSGVGGGLSDILRRMSHEGHFGSPGVVIGEVVGGSSATDPLHYLNKNAEMTWQLRMMLEAGRGRLPDRPELLADLGAPWARMQGARRAVDSNEIVRPRLGRSPDEGNALRLTVFQGERQDVGSTDEQLLMAQMTEDQQQAHLFIKERQAFTQRQMDNLFGTPGIIRNPGRPDWLDPDNPDVPY